MRQKVEPKLKHKARGVSLPPSMEREAVRKATKLDISFSKYVQRLIRIDLEKHILASQ